MADVDTDSKIQAQGQSNLLHTALSAPARAIEEKFCEMEDAGEATDDILLSLSFLLGKNLLQKALEIVDTGGVTKVQALPSGRFFFQVEGTGVFPYSCFFHHCPCPAFAKSCVLNPEHFYCKHLLAVRIANALGPIDDADGKKHGKTAQPGGKHRLVYISDQRYAEALVFTHNTLTSDSDIVLSTSLAAPLLQELAGRVGKEQNDGQIAAKGMDTMSAVSSFATFQ